MARAVITPNALAANVFEKHVQTTAIDATYGAEITWDANDERYLIFARNDYDENRTDTFEGDGTETEFTLSSNPVTSITSIKVAGSALGTDNITDTLSGDGATKVFQLTHIPITSITSVTVDASLVELPNYAIDLTTGVLTLVAAPADDTDNVVVVYVAPTAATVRSTGVVTFDTAPADKAAIEIKFVDDTNTTKTFKVLKGDSSNAVLADLEVSVPQDENWIGWIESGKYKQLYNTTADTAKKGKVLITGDANIKLAVTKV